MSNDQQVEAVNYTNNIVPSIDTKNAIVIAVSNTKGGSAKTTTSIELCRKLQLLGYKVKLIDTDPQANAVQMADIFNAFHARRHKSAKVFKYPRMFDHMQIIDDDLPRLIKEDKPNYDFIIIDGIGSAVGIGSNIWAESIQCADFVLVPVRPSILDYAGTQQMILAVVENRDKKDGPPGAVLCTLCDKSKETYTEIARYQKLGLPILETIVKHRKIHSNCFKSGNTIYEAGFRGLSAQLEFDTFVNELFKFMKEIGIKIPKIN